METIHHVIAFGAVAIVAIGIGWSFVLAVTKRTAGSSFERFQAAVVSLLIVAAASGVLLLISGARPAEGLHLLYAAIAIAIIPLARSFFGRASAGRAAALMLVVFAVLGGVVYRLFTTG